MQSIEQAVAAMNRDDWPAARTHWGDALQQEAEAFWPQYWYANCLIHTGEREEGARRLRAMLTDTREPYVIKSRVAELSLEENDPDAALPLFRDVAAMPEAVEWQVHRLATWTIRLMLSRPGYPASLFELPEDLLARVRFA